MIIKKECLKCLKNQSLSVSSLTNQSEKITQEIIFETQNILSSLKELKDPPPKIAIDVYKKISEITNSNDIYADIKSKCIKIAKKITQEILCNKPEFASQEKDLSWGIKIAALGNIIDYGSQTSFDISNSIFDYKSLDFEIFDFQSFFIKLKKAKNLLYIADNAGENIFDEILISIIKKYYTEIKITYLLRGKPIINDITLNDILNHSECQIKSYAELQDSGVPSPGFIYELANKQTQDLFNQSDLILAKGMGNFECLENLQDERIFLLFKIKCQVVSDFLKIPLGKMIFRQNNYQ